MFNAILRITLIIAFVVAASVSQPAAVRLAIPDNVDVAFSDWMTPSSPPFPHDPEWAPDGSVWYTAQRANTLGRLDPKTGTFRELPFFDLFGANKLGSIDPQTMKITEYELPDPKARPRRIEIARDDIVYYTDYARGFLGRLDPRTGKVEEFASPGGGASRPYGIAITSDGAVWYAETGVDTKNMLVRFNPETKKMLTWAIPSGGGTVRHMVASPQDELWLADSGVGKITRAKPFVRPTH